MTMKRRLVLAACAAAASLSLSTAQAAEKWNMSAEQPDGNYITVIAKEFADNVAKAEIETAMAMNDAQLAALKTSLARHFGKTIEAEVRVNPALIGGVRITVGDRVIDGSVQGKLTTMANELSA